MLDSHPRYPKSSQDADFVHVFALFPIVALLMMLPSLAALLENATNLPPFDRTDCQDIPKEKFDIMGYSIRTSQWRFTEWRVWDGTVNFMVDFTVDFAIDLT